MQQNSLKKDGCNFFNSRWIDLTQFEVVYGGKDCTTYLLDTNLRYQDLYNYSSVSASLYSAVVVQARPYSKTIVSTESLDNLLGIIGGFTALIWDIIYYMMSEYQSFQFNRSLIGEIYSTTDNSRMKTGSEPEDQDGAIEDLHKSLETHAKYKYTYREHLLSSTMKCICCCFKNAQCYKRRVKRLQRHEVAQEQLSKETDFFKFLKLLRISDFISRLSLKKYQRNLVPYFKKYQLTELEGDKKSRFSST